MSRQALRTTIITGANKGIGLAVADNLAGKEGWSLILACRNIERAEQARRKLLEKHPRASIEVE
jgi:NAD(P)-dependent dehydrogenase (short-subunit alcohol dehydrogenase family)